MLVVIVDFVSHRARRVLVLSFPACRLGRGGKLTDLLQGQGRTHATQEHRESGAKFEQLRQM